MFREEMEEMVDGTSTVNGPDVVTISWQPCSGRPGREHQNRFGESLGEGSGSGKTSGTHPRLGVGGGLCI